MTSQNESFFDLVEKLAEWSTQDVKEHLVHTLPVLLISFTCSSASFWMLRFYFRVFLIYVYLIWSYRILECPDQKALSLQAVQALLNKCLPCIPVNDVEDKLFQYVLPSTRQLFNEVIYFFSLLNCCNMHKCTMKLILVYDFVHNTPLLMMFFNFLAKNCVTIVQINHNPAFLTLNQFIITTNG
jgi:hypothetical protein